MNRPSLFLFSYAHVTESMMRDSAEKCGGLSNRSDAVWIPVWVRTSPKHEKKPDFSDFFLAEKERFELRGKPEIWECCTKLSTNKSNISVAKYQTVIIRDNPVVAWLWHWLGSVE